MDFDLSFLEENGIDVKAGIEFAGNKMKYINALKRFLEGYEVSSRNAEVFFEKGDLENYCILVHALKSNSKMIGAMSLAKEFEKLEIASREENRACISENHPGTLKDYQDITELIRQVTETVSDPSAEMIDGEKAKDIASRLLETLDDFDDELSKELAHKLSGYSFDPAQKKELDKALSLINDFMYDDAAEIIKKISVTIK